MQPLTFKLAAILFLAALAVGVSLVVLAEDENSASEVDQRQAKMLAVACYNCHGTDGSYGEDGVPAIAGVPSSILRAQLLAFKAGQMPNTTVMNRLVGGYSEAELAVLADYFADKSPADADDASE